MAFTFTPPTIAMPIGTDRLWSRFFYDVGVTLVKQNGFYRQVPSPEESELLAADLFYLGGYEYTVSDEEALALRGAGYGDRLTPIHASTGYGAGRYGVGAYGEGDLGESGYGSGPYGEGEYGG